MIADDSPATRRRAILDVSVDMLVMLSRYDARPIKVIDNMLPTDARVVTVTTDWERPDVLRIVLESAAFEPVHESERLPILPSPIFRYLEAE